MQPPTAKPSQPARSPAAARARGSAYVDGTYALRFPGHTTGGIDQDREWPRSGASDRQSNAIAPDTVPLRVVNASYEAALIELATPGSLSVMVAPGKIKKRVKVEGAVEVEYAVGSGSAAEQQPVVATIEGLLAPLLITASFPSILVV
jgi:hypothetical protein